MKTTQWIIIGICAMLVFVNARMLGVQDGSAIWDDIHCVYEDFCDHNEGQKLSFRRENNQIQSELSPDQVGALYEVDSLRKDQVMNQFIALLKEYAHKKQNTHRGCARIRKRKDRNGKRACAFLDKLNMCANGYEKLVTLRNNQPIAMDSHLDHSAISNETVLKSIKEMNQKLDTIFSNTSLHVKDAHALEGNAPRSECINEIKKSIDDLYSRRQQEQYIDGLMRSMPSADQRGMQYAQPVQQMQPLPIAPQAMMPQQPLYGQHQQLYNQQTAQMAMQLQSQAMAMQEQASMLLMQAQQPMIPMMQQPMIQQPCNTTYSPYVSTQRVPSRLGMHSSTKMSRLMNILEELAHLGGGALQQLMLLINMEFELVEHLITNSKGSIIQRLVCKKENLIQMSSPAVVDAYMMVLDLATSTDEDIEPHYYRFVIKSEQRPTSVSKKYGQNSKSPKQIFLKKMMYALERYYIIIENMQKAMAELKH